MHLTGVSRTVEDLQIATRVMLGKLHSKVPIPYREDVAIEMRGKKLKFGYYLSGKPALRHLVHSSIEN